MTIYWGSTIFALIGVLISIVIIGAIIVGISYVVKFMRKANRALDLMIENEEQKKL